MPFLLSTSQTPTAVYDYGADGNYETLCGGFGPTHPDGYGICYDIYGDDLRTSTATKLMHYFECGGIVCSIVIVFSAFPCFELQIEQRVEGEGVYGSDRTSFGGHESVAGQRVLNTNDFRT